MFFVLPPKSACDEQNQLLKLPFPRFQNLRFWGFIDFRIIYFSRLFCVKKLHRGEILHQVIDCCSITR